MPFIYSTHSAETMDTCIHEGRPITTPAATPIAISEHTMAGCHCLVEDRACMLPTATLKCLSEDRDGMFPLSLWKW